MHFQKPHHHIGQFDCGMVDADESEQDCDSDPGSALEEDLSDPFTAAMEMLVGQQRVRDIVCTQLAPPIPSKHDADRLSCLA